MEEEIHHRTMTLGSSPRSTRNAILIHGGIGVFVAVTSYLVTRWSNQTVIHNVNLALAEEGE